jgi:uncharacterized sulfatase
VARKTRREFLGQAVRGAAGALLAPAAIGAAASPATESARGGTVRPNILWITCEDMSPDLGCWGDAYAASPNLDRLAAEGVRYTGCFTVAPVCAPSRSAIITGMYPTTIGSMHMRTGNKGYQCVPPPEVKCFTEYLRAAGYYCTNDNKTDYQFAAPVTAWDECRKGAHWRARAGGQPFFAVINLTITHESQSWPIEKPLRHDPAKAVLPPYYPDTPTVRRNWARYHDTITMMDGQAGKVLADLEADGLADSTIVFFYSDHGRGLTRAKRWVYDSGIHVPLIVRWPGRRAAGSAEARLVSFIDLGPTVLSLAGVPAPKHMQGRPFLGPQAAAPRPYVFAARDRMDETYDCIRAVRDSRYKYIRNYQPEKPYAQPIAYMDKMPMLKEMRALAAEGKLEGPPALFFRAAKPIEELYDTHADPHEVNDLAASAAHADVLKRLRAVHEAWRKETGDLGLLPEEAVKERMWPGGVQPETAAPTIARKGGLVEIACPTPGASVAWTDEAGDRPHWKLYAGPIQAKAGAAVRAKAVRIGFKESPEARAAV